MPSGTYFDLPFAYEATVMPGPRHTRPRHVTLRADAIVEVPILARRDFAKVADLVHAPSPVGYPIEAPCAIYERGGRLFSPMTTGGRFVDAAEFQSLLREAAATARFQTGNGGLNRNRYPMRDARHRRDGVGVLNELALGDFATRHGWPAPRVLHCDFDEALGSATTYMMDAIAVVDGEVWAECSEPTWRIRHLEYNRWGLVLEFWPEPLRAHGTFRLDERDRALDYVRSRRRRVDPADQDPPVDILVPSSITRNDLTEIAAATLRCWPHLRYWCWGRRGRPLDETAALLNQFHLEGEVAMPDIPAVMDGIAAVAAGPGADFAPRARNHADVAAIYEGVRRWAYEKANVDPRSFDPANDDDWLALQDLEL